MNDFTKEEQNKILSKISNHLINHEECALKICPLIINKKELAELMSLPFITMTISGKKIHEILLMEHGFVGEFSGVSLYLWDKKNE